jgi:hypothetical protein
MRTLVIGIALLTACGTDSIALADFSAAHRDALCRHAASCGDIESVDACHKVNPVITSRLDPDLLQAIDMGKSKYDAQNAASCLDALATRSCDVTSQSGRDDDPEACRNTFVGTLPAGESCAFDAECISASCDAPASCPMACCLGTCQGDTAPGHAARGESCEHAFCDASSFCDTATQRCVALQPSGGFCGKPAECQYGLDCGQDTTCASLPKLGDSCHGACRDVGTTCSASSGTCVKVALSGQPCVASTDCASVYFCDATKHCSAGLPLGAACTALQRCADDGASCYVLADQTMGTCELAKANGEPCGRHANCDSGYCDPIALTCADPPVCI